jgi:hypothetical protein
LTVGINEVFNNVVKYLKRNYPKAEDISMPYCALIEKTDTENEYYRAEVHFKLSGDFLGKTAVLKANPKDGAVYWFQLGYTWKHWI